ncbi:MAG: hypothetical protein NTV79_01100, partial [Candidatus Aureabacteria bacterium]|nr:hypothetical protein [Candidatus Auribacterota bacterium]
KAVALKNLVSQLGRDSPRNHRLPFKGLQNVLARFEISPVNMALDLKTFLVPQFSQASRILADPADLANLLSRQNLSDVGNQ